jgi:hypothetical protein
MAMAEASLAHAAIADSRATVMAILEGGVNGWKE